MTTPCSDWDVCALVCHVINTHWRVEGNNEKQADPKEDIPSQWIEASGAVQAALGDPIRSSATVSGIFGEQPFSSLVSRLLCADTLYHTWDLAKAIGQHVELDEEAMAYALEFLTPLDEAIRIPGGFAPKIISKLDADLQTRFLNFGGRSDWRS
ncbi:MAG: hypothetical protein M1483_02300 [Actinobacteria bacterium]|nr:hypothetical protein [Actinomycetota bacterium]MCL6104460.1 hypothetical protein [Actinomycetota bacterium]